MMPLNPKVSSKLVSIMLLAFSACSSVEVHTERAPNSDFSHYKTFSWSRGEQSGVRPQSSILNQEIRTAVNHDLARKGLSRTNDGSADLLVGYKLRAKTVYGDEGDIGVNPGYWAWNDAELFPVNEGTFSLVLVDSKTNKIVWRGKATNLFDKGAESDKQIEEAVNDLLKKFPTT